MRSIDIILNIFILNVIDPFQLHVIVRESQIKTGKGIDYWRKPIRKLHSKVLIETEEGDIIKSDETVRQIFKERDVNSGKKRNEYY